MKKNYRILMVLVVSGLLFSIPSKSFAGPFGGGFKEGHDKEGRMGKGFDELFEKLNISDEQKKQLKENKIANREEFKNTREEIRSKRDALRDEINKPELDINKINAIHNELKVLQNQSDDQHLKGILEVRKILTNEQFMEFQKNMEEKWSKRKEGHKKLRKKGMKEEMDEE